jgi:hypothetical protein
MKRLVVVELAGSEVGGGGACSSMVRQRSDEHLLGGLGTRP